MHPASRPDLILDLSWLPVDFAPFPASTREKDLMVAPSGLLPR
jgi:hypothetical protein